MIFVKFDPLITNIVLFFIQIVLFLSYFTVNIQYGRHLGSIFKKLSFGSRDLCDVRCRGESKQQIYFIRRIWRFRSSSEDNQRDRVLPHQFKPEPIMQTSDGGDESDQNSMKGVSRLPRKSTMCLRPKIVSALKPLAGVNAHCTLKPRTIELFNGCCDEALEYDEYNASLKDTDAQLR